jgi:hypothetical protein
MSPASPSLILLLRIMAGVLALLSLAVVAIRLYAYSGAGGEGGLGDLMLSLRLLFPLTLGLFLGYWAIKGKMPFTDDGEGQRKGSGSS